MYPSALTREDPPLSKKGSISSSDIAFAVIPIAALILLLCGCSVEQSAELDEPLALYRENRLELALPLFEQVVTRQNGHAEAHAWLAETYRRLGMKDKAVRSAERALELDPCSCFAHTVIADACRQPPGTGEFLDSDTTWVHLIKAVACDSTDGNPWTSIWCEAILRSKFELMHRSVRRMKETGFLTKAILAYGRWMLRTLPENAVILTNGDMDTFSPLALQVTENFRPDVVVVERGQLGVTQFLRYIRDQRGVPLPFGDSQLDSLTAFEEEHGEVVSISDQIFTGWAEQSASGSFTRPIAISVTVDEKFYSRVKDRLQYAGPYLLLRPEPVGELHVTGLLGECLADIRQEDFSGPWASTEDRSPVRGLYTKGIASNVTEAAVVYGEVLIREGKLAEAEKILNRAEDFEKMTEQGSVFMEQIRLLRETLEVQKQQVHERSAG